MTLSSSIEPYLRESRESETLLINQMSQLMESQKKTIYKFGFGQSPFPVPQHVVSAMAEASYRKEYMAVQGHQALREAIANFHNSEEEQGWFAEDVIIGVGSKVLLYCIMAAFTKTEILIPAPSWVSYAPQAELAGHNIHWLQTSFENKWKITPDNILAACKNINKSTPKLLILNYPSNPTGQTYSSAELESFVEILRGNNVLVIADEIYGFLQFEGKSSHIEDYYPEGVLVTSGLSKWCGAGGWRLGYVHVPTQLSELKKRIIGLASETYSCAASPVQIAATKAYENIPAAKDFLSKQKKALRHIAEFACYSLQEAGVDVHMAEGGFYLFPDFLAFAEKLKHSGITSSQALTQKIMQDIGVALLPGTAFGMPASSLTARLAFVDFDGAALLNDHSDEIHLQKLKTGLKWLCHWAKNL